MGMAASQARLLSITARLADNELRSQTINNAKMRLASETAQASDDYVEALNQAQLMFQNAAIDGTIQNQILTFNSLNSFSPYNTQYGLVSPSGQIYVSEDEAKIYEHSADLNDFLKKHGLEWTTTYFDNDDAMTTLANSAYPILKKENDDDENQSIFEATRLQNLLGTDNPVTMQDLKNEYEKYIAYDTSVECYNFNTYISALNVENNRLVSNCQTLLYPEDTNGGFKALLPAQNAKGFKNAANQDVNCNPNAWIQEKLLGDPNWTKYLSDPAIDYLQNYYTSTFEPVSRISDTDTGTYKIKLGDGETDLETPLNFPEFSIKMNNGYVTGITWPKNSSNDYINSFISGYEENEETGEATTTPVNTGFNISIDKSILRDITTGNIPSDSIDTFGTLGTISTGNKAQDDTSLSVKLKSGLTLEDLMNAITIKFNKGSGNEMHFTYNLERVSVNNVDLENGETITTITQDANGDYYQMKQTMTYDKNLETIADGKSDYYSELDGILQEILTIDGFFSYSQYIKDNSSNAVFDSFFVSEGTFINFVFGDNAKLNTLTNKHDALPDSLTTGDNNLKIEQLLNFDNIVKLVANDGLIDSDGNKTLVGIAGLISPEMRNVIRTYVIDQMIEVLGEPKYAWIDSTDYNNSGNPDAKAQWYTNLYKRMQKGYKVLEDGLANSADWMKFALESGLVSMEQVDPDFNWNPLDYKVCSVITEATVSDAAVAKAEAAYNRAMNDIEKKDSIYDIQLKNIDTEHNSLQTEYEVIQKVINKNIDRTLKFNQSA